MKATTSTLHSQRTHALDRARMAPRNASRACAWRLLSWLARLVVTHEPAREDFLAASVDHEDYERRLCKWVEHEREERRRAMQPPVF
jgi:hypothetical protein